MNEHHFRPTCMCSLVYLQVLAPGENLSTAGEGAGEGFLPGVDPDVVDQLVLGLEWAAHPRAALPETGVVTDLRTPNMLHCQVSHHLVVGVLVVGVWWWRWLVWWWGFQWWWW